MLEAIDLLLPALWIVGVGAIFVLGRKRIASHPKVNGSNRSADQLEFLRKQKCSKPLQ